MLELFYYEQRQNHGPRWRETFPRKQEQNIIKWKQNNSK